MEGIILKVLSFLNYCLPGWGLSSLTTKNKGFASPPFTMKLVIAGVCHVHCGGASVAELCCFSSLIRRLSSLFFS